MTRFRQTVDPNSPGIARQARRYERLLRRAVAIASRRDTRRDPALAALYASAKIEGVDTTLRTKTATVSFCGPPLKGSFHQMREWSSLPQYSVHAIADGISFSLRYQLRFQRKA